MILLLVACGVEDAAPADPCDDVPYASWETFGAGFVTENCTGCHSSTSTNRREAPEDINFDSAADVWLHADRILVRAGAEPPTMPPLGGTTADDRELLRAWLECAEEGQ